MHVINYRCITNVSPHPVHRYPHQRQALFRHLPPIRSLRIPTGLVNGTDEAPMPIHTRVKNAQLKSHNIQSGDINDITAMCGLIET